MLDTNRFSKLRNLHDIKLERARLKYEMLLAEKHLAESLDGIRTAADPRVMFGRITDGYEVAMALIGRIRKMAGWFSGRKKKSRRAEANV